MDQKDYLEQSERTAASAVKLNHDIFSDRQVLHESVEIIHAGMTADALKRSLFYSDPKIEERIDASTAVILNIYDKIFVLPDDFEIPADKINLLHAYLGIASEAGEIAEEIVMSILDKREVNIVNLEEEEGDSFWYHAMLLRELQKRVTDRVIDFSTSMFKNIEKLKKRYPHRFTTEDALNRDLDEEQRVLNS